MHSHAHNFHMHTIFHPKYPACHLPAFHFLGESSCKIQVVTSRFAALNHEKKPSIFFYNNILKFHNMLYFMTYM